MKKIENTFVVTGFVGNNAEIRQFTNASVDVSHWQSAVRRRMVRKPTEYQLS